MSSYPSLKIRAWVPKDNEMLYSGFFIHPETGLAVILENNPYSYSTIYKSPEEYITMLSTGLFDKTGDLIFDNDILFNSVTKIYSLVRFGDTFEQMGDDGYYGWYVENINVSDLKFKYSQLNESIDTSSYVVGNAFETPQFLNVNK